MVEVPTDLFACSTFGFVGSCHLPAPAGESVDSFPGGPALSIHV
jgi:hypothetical protein